jgi:hypothetical protein
MPSFLMGILAGEIWLGANLIVDGAVLRYPPS